MSLTSAYSDEHRPLAACRLLTTRTTCRSSTATSQRALHVAQVLQMAAEHGPAGPAGDRPERLYPD